MYTRTYEITNSQDIIDSRNVIKRIEELQDMKDDFQVDNELPDSDLSNMPDEQADKWLEWNESDEGQELKALLDLQSQAEGYSDWNHGATLIRDSYFDNDFAEQEMKDFGYLTDDLPDIIRNNIDWKGIKEDLQMDYASVEFDGVTYWIR